MSEPEQTEGSDEPIQLEGIDASQGDVEVPSGAAKPRVTPPPLPPTPAAPVSRGRPAAPESVAAPMSSGKKVFYGVVIVAMLGVGGFAGLKFASSFGGAPAAGSAPAPSAPAAAPSSASASPSVAPTASAAPTASVLQLPEVQIK